MDKQRCSELVSILSKHPKVVDVYEGDGNRGDVGQVFVVTSEDADDSDACSFGNDVLDTLGVQWFANDCEGCYNEYMIG